MSKSDNSATRSAGTRFLEALGLMLLGLLLAALAGELFLKLFRPQVFDIHPVGMYMEDPDLGYRLTPGFAGTIKRSEFEVPVRIGEGGLRAWNGETRAPGVFRILVLGDSQAFGFGVGDQETLAWQLEQMLTAAHPERAIEVINGGIPGFGTADQLAFLAARGAEIDPDVIILQFLSVNDLAENRYPAVTWATIEDGMLTAKEAGDSSQEEFLDVVRRWHRYLKLHSHLLRLSSDSAGYLAIRLGWSGRQQSLWGEDFSAEDAAIGRRLLIDFARVGRDLGSDTIFLFTTGQAHVLQGTVDSLRSREVVESAATAARCRWIDVGSEMSRRPDRLDLYYRKDGHWTPEGHRATAEIVAPHLEPDLSAREAADDRQRPVS